MPLARWFLAYFPAIPKVVLTSPGETDPPAPTRRWSARPAEIFRHPERNREKLQRAFRSFWSPRFWTALREYVCNRAGTNWHTPGHNGGNAFDNSPFLRGFHDDFGDMTFRADLSVSVERLGDLSSPEGSAPLVDAQRLAELVLLDQRHVTVELHSVIVKTIVKRVKVDAGFLAQNGKAF